MMKFGCKGAIADEASLIFRGPHPSSAPRPLPFHRRNVNQNKLETARIHTGAGKQGTKEQETKEKETKERGLKWGGGERGIKRQNAPSTLCNLLGGQLSLSFLLPYVIRKDSYRRHELISKVSALSLGRLCGVPRPLRPPVHLSFSLSNLTRLVY